MISPTQCLALVLCWYRFRGSEYILQGWFGFTGTHCNIWLRFGRRMLLKALWKEPIAKVTMPTDEKIAMLTSVTEAKHGYLKGVYCVADGLKLSFQSCDGLDEQSMYYNGWTHGHYITNLLVFSMDGRIINAVLNAPGSVHDSTLAEWGNVYETLESVYLRTGGRCCLDSAFAAKRADYLIKSAQNLNVAKDATELNEMSQATSIRQAAEWGMRAVQSAFPRLTDKIKFEENGERRVFLALAVMLYNVRLELVGLNQIRNTYVPSLSRDADFIID
jgi:DDE superfamily endonuclease